MQLLRLYHVNIPTANLAKMIDWYVDIMGMRNGWRPDFPFPGAWLYVGDDAVVHLVDVDDEPKNIDPKIEHFAIRATGLTELLARIKKTGAEARLARVPGVPIIQANIFDPDGNHIHVDFPIEEAEAAGL